MIIFDIIFLFNLVIKFKMLTSKHWFFCTQFHCRNPIKSDALRHLFEAKGAADGAYSIASRSTAIAGQNSDPSWSTCHQMKIIICHNLSQSSDPDCPSHRHGDLLRILFTIGGVLAFEDDVEAAAPPLWRRRLSRSSGEDEGIKKKFFFCLLTNGKWS